jgi:hypothetical protein
MEISKKEFEEKKERDRGDTLGGEDEDEQEIEELKRL